MLKRICGLLAVVGGLLLATTPALAQYRYQYPVPVVPPTIYAPYAGPGGALRGSADVISAQGQFMNQQEQARIEREKAYQEFLKSQKQAFELKKYIEANTPTYTERIEKDKGMRTRRILNAPTTSEISSGEALNVMLDFLQQVGRQGQMGPPISLDPQTLDHINVTVPTDKSNVSILRNGGQLNWPLALRGQPLQKELEKSIPMVVEGAANGTLDPQLYFKVRKDVLKFRDDVKQQYINEQIDANSYLLATRFFEQLVPAINALERPDAAQLVGGNFKAQGRNVQELVVNMSQKGLKFAPSSPGDESAYMALHSAMADYAVGVQHDFGFQLQTVMPRKEFKIQP